MIKTSKKSIFKDQCNHIVDFYSSAKIVVSKGKLYPYPQLVTLHPLNIELQKKEPQSLNY